MAVYQENMMDELDMMCDMEDEDEMTFFPNVIEQTHRGERAWDIFSRLLKDRIVILAVL